MSLESFPKAGSAPACSALTPGCESYFYKSMSTETSWLSWEIHLAETYLLSANWELGLSV